jgi:hypothetical protein
MKSKGKRKQKTKSALFNVGQIYTQDEREYKAILAAAKAEGRTRSQFGLNAIRFYLKAKSSAPDPAVEAADQLVEHNRITEAEPVDQAG